MRCKQSILVILFLSIALTMFAQNSPPTTQPTAPTTAEPGKAATAPADAQAVAPPIKTEKTPEAPLSSSATPAPANNKAEASPAPTKDATKEQKLVAEEPGTLISEEKLYSGARIYVAPMMNGFDNYIVAGLQQKKVPVVVVALREKADYEITGIAETDKAGWAKMLFIGSQQTNESASIKMVNLKTGAVVFAYSVNKMNSVRGKQSAGEACAKHIKQKIVE